MGVLIDGKKIAQEIKKDLALEFKKLDYCPEFHIVYAGSDPVIDNFIEYKKVFGAALGVSVLVHTLPSTSTTQDVLDCIADISSSADGVIVQLPLPEALDREIILNAVPAEKDIDVLGTVALANFTAGDHSFYPPVAGSIVRALESQSLDLHALRVLVLGKGALVGYPFSLWLEREGYSYDVIDHTTDKKQVEQLLSSADVVVTGVGQPHMVQPHMIKKGAILIDAGTSESGKKIVGDIDPACYLISGAYTPVPGGIGPITIAVLYQNLLKACLSHYVD